MKNNQARNKNTSISSMEGGTIEQITIEKPIRKLDLYYVTDPLCSYCWEIDPILQKLNAHYSQYYNLTIVMGGLLKDWNNFSDPRNSIQSPADVAAHWQEVSETHRMPISGKIWLNNAVQSSYPASIVYKLIEQKDPMKARKFLRIVREAVMVWNRNIADDDMLILLVNELGLDGNEIVKLSHTAIGYDLLQQDMDLAEELGANSFPTVIIMNHKQKGIRITGHYDFETYEEALKSFITNETIKKQDPPLLAHWLKDTKRLFAKEIEVMYDLSMNELVPFIKKELTPDQYRVDEAVNELYLEWEYQQKE